MRRGGDFTQPRDRADEAVQKRQLLVQMLPGSAAAQAVEAIAAKIAP